MYIDKLKLWNFRKYGKETFALDDPHLTVEFNSGLNVLIGDNDSGKTAILDAIKLTLRTHSYEWIRIEEKDFYNGASKMRIEIEFKGLEDNEARHFIEWLGWYEEQQEDGSKINRPLLRIIHEVEQTSDRILPSDICAGMDNIGTPLNALAREFLKTTYLKALRDADNELIAKRNSRVSQILRGHELLKLTEGNHELVDIFEDSNSKTRDWFKKEDVYPEIKEIVDSFIQAFISADYESKFDVSGDDIVQILEKISVGIVDKYNLGLGTQNRLYMAMELLHLKKKNWDGVRLCLIEELEAHLHPQAQMKVIETLQKEENVQFILTTHSPNIASKVPLKSLIICKDNNIYPMGNKYTKLHKNNYKHLKRFLDATKSNLFFAKGVILVEGWSEEILLPVLAKKMGYDLTAKEISIVNVGSTAYLHFAKIFLRDDDKQMKVPVAIVTDLDNRPNKDGKFEDSEKVRKRKQYITDLSTDFKDTAISLEIAKEWTLEWCLYKSSKLSELFKESVQKVHCNTEEFKYAEGTSNFKPEFEAKFISKLRKDKGTSELDKLTITSTLAEKIEKDIAVIIDDSDEYIKYLVNAIKYVCQP